MSKTILGTVDGWTPVIDGVVDDVGAVTALVFGKMWRYCQMVDGVCKASQDRIAQELGMSRQTVNAHVEKLVKAGYMEDTTPDLSGLPHVYRDTGKANLSINLTGKINNLSKNLTPTCQISLHPPVKKFDTKKEVKKESINDTLKIIIAEMENRGMYPNSRTLGMVQEWIEAHTTDWIVKALDMSVGKGQNYADKILLGWESQGYPKPRSQQVAERKSAHPQQKQPSKPRAESL